MHTQSRMNKQDERRGKRLLRTTKLALRPQEYNQEIRNEVQYKQESKKEWSHHKRTYNIVSKVIVLNLFDCPHAGLTKAFVPSNTQDDVLFYASLAQGKCTSVTHVVGILLTDTTKMPTCNTSKRKCLKEKVKHI